MEIILSVIENVGQLNHTKFCCPDNNRSESSLFSFWADINSFALYEIVLFVVRLPQCASRSYKHVKDTRK